MFVERISDGEKNKAMTNDELFPEFLNTLLGWRILLPQRHTNVLLVFK